MTDMPVLPFATRLRLRDVTPRRCWRGTGDAHADNLAVTASDQSGWSFPGRYATVAVGGPSRRPSARTNSDSSGPRASGCNLRKMDLRFRDPGRRCAALARADDRNSLLDQSRILVV